MVEMIHPSRDAWKHFHKSAGLSRYSFTYLRGFALLYPEARQTCGSGCVTGHGPLNRTPPSGRHLPLSPLRWKHDGVVNIPPLPHGTILLVEVGSTAHGTGLPGSEDQDETAIVVESPELVFGLDPSGPATIMQRTQPEGVKSGPGDIDRTLHPLRRFLYLAASGNPSVLMSLWAPVLEATPEGLELQGIGGA